MPQKFSRREILASAIAGLSAIIAGCEAPLSLSQRYKDLSIPTWEEMNSVNPPRSVFDIQDMIARIPYRQEFFPETWKSAKRTAQEGGDCEDKAFLACYLLEKYLGLEPILLAIKEEKHKKAHAGAIIKIPTPEKTEYGFLDQEYVVLPEHESVEEVIRFVNAFDKKVLRVKDFVPYTLYYELNLWQADEEKIDWRYSKKNLYPEFVRMLRNTELKKLKNPESPKILIKEK